MWLRFSKLGQVCCCIFLEGIVVSLDLLLHEFHEWLHFFEIIKQEYLPNGYN